MLKQSNRLHTNDSNTELCSQLMAKKNLTQDDLIIQSLGRGPMVSLYYTIAIDVLKQVIEQNDDDFVYQLFFGGMIPNRQIRECVNKLDQTLNPSK